MPVRVFKNPKSLVRALLEKGVFYEFLVEARECIGVQKLAKLFEGRSMKDEDGCQSADTIIDWINTYVIVQEHPDEEDSDRAMMRKIVPKKGWFDYVALLMQPIDEEEMQKWDSLSQKKLADCARKIGYMQGLSNSGSLKTLKERMQKMTERRRENIWSKIDENGDFVPTMCFALYSTLPKPNLKALSVSKTTSGTSSSTGVKESVDIDLQAVEKDRILLDHYKQECHRMIEDKAHLLEVNKQLEKDVAQLKADTARLQAEIDKRKSAN